MDISDRPGVFWLHYFSLTVEVGNKGDTGKRDRKRSGMNGPAIIHIR